MSDQEVQEERDDGAPIEVLEQYFEARGWACERTAEGEIVASATGSWALAGQFAQALRNTLAILAEDGAGPEHIVRMTCYVVDRSDYLSSRDEIGTAWREVMGRNYPAMALVEVKGLVESSALVEIETTAVVEE